MKPLAQIRRARLEQMIREDFKGRAQALADKIGKDRRQISAWRRYKGMHDETAREIEAAALKPSGWLDHEHEPLPKAPMRERQESQFQRLNPEILHEALVLLVHDESQAGAYPPRDREARIAELYERVAVDGGRLTKEHNADFIREVEARRKGVDSGQRARERGRS